MLKKASIAEYKQDDTAEWRNSEEQQKFPIESTKDEEIVEPSFKPWRVFVNRVDSYHGRKLADHLSERVYVNPQAEELAEEEEEEEEYEGETDEVERREEKLEDSPKNYEIIGTISDPDNPTPEDVTMIIKEPRDRDALLEELMKCGIVIYDIAENEDQVEEARWAMQWSSGSQDPPGFRALRVTESPRSQGFLRYQGPRAIVQELEKMEQAAPKAFKRNNEVRYFVLISTLMTWALTKPLNPDEPNLPFTEEDYRKRKPHPNFKPHIQCEKEVVITRKKTKLKDKLKTLVICCGITYGDEQSSLHHLFKMAWQNSPFLPIFGKGNNKIPLLHVRDLISVILDVLQNWPPLRYIVAAEQEPTSQTNIVKKISRALSTGKVKKIAEEEAFLLPEITQRTFDLMMMNLIVDPVYITDRISWHLDAPFRDNINAIVKEYKAARNLQPIRIIVLGPPASGKTKIARHLADHYRIHYVHVKPLIVETIEKLTNEIEEARVAQDEAEQAGENEEEEEEEDVEEEEGAVNVEERQELLDEIERNMQRTNGRLDDALLNKLFLRKLRSKESSNQGYVMDGHPKTFEQAKELFGGGNLNELEEEIEEEDETDTMDTVMPELVVSLEASDDFLKERIIQRPEREIQGTHYTEEHMMRRLKEYRKRNTDDNTPLQFFDEIEIHPLIIDIEGDVCPDMFPTIYQCLQRVGLPRNYESSNQGYVMDGHPKTFEQAKELFGGGNLNELEEEIEEEDETDTMDTVMPELVVSLEASDDFLKERIIQRPEREIQGTHYTEEHMMRRLKEYRKRNTDDNTPLQFFDEIEIHPLIIDIEGDVCPDMFPTIYQCLQRVGLPRNYGLTAAEARDARLRGEAEARAAEAAAELQEEKEMLERKRLREEKMAEWTNLMEKLKEEEEERLCLSGMPLRHYLVKYVFPTLTQGLIKVANLRPQDPVDFLAEYLFKENPEGKMFEPDYTETMSSVLDIIEKFGDDVLPEEELGEKIMHFLKRHSRVTKDSDVDVCTDRKVTSCFTPCFTYDETDSYEGEEEGTTSKQSADDDKEDTTRNE
ncbi:Adenylate kinase 7 [Habropoda laboriosa]|uniref:Adenylate kinase 7 n=1 Tax=Habropoda laboriosa TaxID=597456 RepID=A0A0L7R5U3_9HYME|nr:Adenylate kinase 7 [Habropoda laboriosa]